MNCIVSWIGLIAFCCLLCAINLWHMSPCTHGSLKVRFLHYGWTLFKLRAADSEVMCDCRVFKYCLQSMHERSLVPCPPQYLLLDLLITCTILLLFYVSLISAVIYLFSSNGFVCTWFSKLLNCIVKLFVCVLIF